jgi:hypothetical protein
MAHTFIVKLPERTESWIAQEAERLEQSETTLVETLAEEGARMWQFPGIAFRGAAQNRRAWAIGAGMDVWEIIEAYQALGAGGRLSAEAEVTEQDLRLALAYFEQYPDEIDQALAANRITLDELVARYPGLISNA